jgi:hypothetical protein
VFSCVWPSDFPAFTRVKHQDLVFDISSLCISWTALLCLLMQSLCMLGSLQHRSTCNHVSGCIILNSEQFMLGKSSFQNKCFLAFSIYCPYMNLRICVICESVTAGLVQKLLEILLSMRGLLIYLFMLSNALASFSFSSFSSFSRYDFRYLIGPLYGWSSSLHQQYGVEWALSCGWNVTYKYYFASFFC